MGWEGRGRRLCSQLPLCPARGGLRPGPSEEATGGDLQPHSFGFPSGLLPVAPSGLGVAARTPPLLVPRRHPLLVSLDPTRSSVGGPFFSCPESAWTAANTGPPGPRSCPGLHPVVTHRHTLGPSSSRPVGDSNSVGRRMGKSGNGQRWGCW